MINWQERLGPPKDRTLPEIIGFLLDAAEVDSARLVELGEESELVRLNTKTALRRAEAGVDAGQGDALELCRAILASLEEYMPASGGRVLAGPWPTPRIEPS